MCTAQVTTLCGCTLCALYNPWVYTVYEAMEDIWDGAMEPHDLGPSAEEVRGTHEDMESDRPAFCLISRRNSKGHNMKSSHHRL